MERLKVRIRNPRDFFGGLALIALALVSFYAGANLSGMTGPSFGPGTAPRLFGSLLLAIGIVVSAVGLLVDGPRAERFAFRGVAFVTIAIIAFAVCIRPLGLVLSSLLSFLVAAMASKETRWIESIVVAVVLTAFCVGIFVFLLHLPFDLWPAILL